jgi:hypothetical protein
LTLGRLNRDDVENIVARVTGGRMLPAEVTEQIVAKTDGNPLFVEELTKTVLEAGILVENHDRYRLDGPLPPGALWSVLVDGRLCGQRGEKGQTHQPRCAEPHASEELPHAQSLNSFLLG